MTHLFPDRPLVCPQCQGPLGSAPDAYHCEACGRRYPILCGIPDFRLEPDRYLSIEDDRAKGVRLHEGSDRRSFAEMLDRYWSMTPEVAPELARKFRAHQLAEERIAEAAWAGPGDPAAPLHDVGCPHPLLSEGGAEPFGGAGPLLDVGCSTAGLVAAAAKRGMAVTGVDAAFRWLVVGQVRLREAGVHATLVCANAEQLPFPGDTFATVTAHDLVEHVADPAPVFRECRRVARPGAACCFSTNNRYSLLPEPHVGVWGVGWLPRSWQADYVRLASGRPYRHLCLRSAGELERWARAAGFAACRVSAAPPSTDPDRWPRGQALYNRMRRWGLFTLVAPRLELVCRK